MDMRLSDPMVGRLLEGRYAVESFIAHGGMATVYLATDNRLERRVAVKVMHAHLSDDPETVARFEREARSAARLSSPEIVSIFDQGSDSGRAYLVMEYVPGVNLRALLRDRGRLTPGEALAVMDHVTSALGTAHAAGLVHRDVKPENVLVTADGRVKLADFGLARAVAGSTVTTTGSVLLGTATYLAPEQFLHGTADARSDVYAAGILLYELLTGSPPYAADNPNALLQRHVSEDIAPPSRTVKGIAPQIDALVTWAASRDPQERPTDAAELHSSLVDVRDRLGLHDRVPALPSTVTTTLPAASARTTGRRGGNDTTRVVKNPPPPGVPTQAVKRRRRRGPIVAAILALIVALAAVAGWWLAEGRYTKVPSGLKGDTKQAADQVLDKAGLHPHWLPAVHSATVPTGEVISWSPSGRIVHGGTVDLTLSLGKVTHVLPKLAGLSQDQATAKLAGLHLGVSGVTHHYSSTIAKGLVIGTDPADGVTLDEGQSVALILSKGQHFVALPTDIDNQQASTVESELEQVGLTYKEHDSYSDTVPEGEVISFTPQKTKAVIGSVIHLNVSKGQQLFPVPAIAPGTSIEKAVHVIERAGFNPDPVGLPVGSGTVFRETPTSPQPRGATIKLYYY